MLHLRIWKWLTAIGATGAVIWAFMSHGNARDAVAAAVVVETAKTAHASMIKEAMKTKRTAEVDQITRDKEVAERVLAQAIEVYEQVRFTNRFEAEQTIRLAQQEVFLITLRQTLLKELGWYEGEVDGVRGPLTEAARQDFAVAADVENTDEMILAALGEVNPPEAPVIEVITPAPEVVREPPPQAPAAPATPAPTPDVPDDPEPEAVPVEPPPSGSAGAMAVDSALAQVGKPYLWGGNGPASFDCSGLTRYAWRAAGVNIPRNSAAQFSQLTRISRSELRPGDLVFFYSPISHVGMYVGNGQVVEAPSTGSRVQVRDIDQTWRTPVGYSRP